MREPDAASGCGVADHLQLPRNAPSRASRLRKTERAATRLFQRSKRTARQIVANQTASETSEVERFAKLLLLSRAATKDPVTTTLVLHPLAREIR